MLSTIICYKYYATQLFSNCKGIDLIKEVSISAICHNIAQIRTVTNSKICAVVKCDAYGHGSLFLSKIIEKDIDCFGVATIDEAIALRQKGITKDIIIFGYAYAHNAQDISNYGLIQGVSSSKELLDLEQSCSKLGSGDCNKIRVHIKINTGLNRLGAKSEELDDIANVLIECTRITLSGLFTHFGTPQDKEYTLPQIKNFKRLATTFITKVERNLDLDKKSLVLHAGASNVLWNKLAHFDMVRIGLAMYGYGANGCDLNLHPAMMVYGKIIKIQKVASGEFVGYSKGYLATRDILVATVDGGYGDGILRGVYKKAKVNNHIVDIIGHISMDMFSIDISNILVNLNDTVYVLGNGLSATDIAKDANTIEYQLLTAMKPRTTTVYID